MNIWIKYAITAAIIVFVSEIAKKSDKIGALIVSLPIVTILTMFWIFFDHRSDERVLKLANHAIYTFWYVVPTLPMFLVIPILLKRGMHFGFVMAIYCISTFCIFYCWAKLLEKFGIHLMP